MAQRLSAIFSRARSFFAAGPPLPLDPELAPASRRGWLRLLFAIEPLDHAAEPAPARRTRWTRWLFAAERLERR